MRDIGVIYHFLKLAVILHGYHPEEASVYDPFRLNYRQYCQQIPEGVGPGMSIFVRQVSKLPVPEGKLVYASPSGLRVLQMGNRTCRTFNNLYTGEYYGLLTEDDACSEAEKVCAGWTLLLLEEYMQTHALSEMALLNMIAPEVILYRHNRIMLHASMIRLRDTGEVVLFSAPCQMGKSTQARLWEQYRDAEVLNGDRAGIFKMNGNWYAGGIPWCGTSGIMENVIAPLKAIVLLDQASQSMVEELPTMTRMRRLLEQTTVNSWNRKMHADIQGILFELCADIPMWHLACTPDESAITTLERVLYGT